MKERVYGWIEPKSWLPCLAALTMLGCPQQELAPLGPCTVSAARVRVEQTGLSKVDLLFVIDNSGSMATEQLKLANELPRLVQVLTTGDRNAGRAPGAGPARGGGGLDTFSPVSSLHLAVVSSNMGGVDEITDAANPSVRSCEGLGDDGRFLRSTEVAVDGVIANEPFEFPGYGVGEEVLPPDPECAEIPTPPSYQVFEAGEEPSAEEVAASFRCVSKIGVRGCSYEQQLEAMWKAVAPSDQDDFLNGTSGHGNPDGENAGFIREDAILAVIHVSDEEDCSINEEGKALFSDSAEAAERFGPEVNLRCGRHGESQGLIWPVSRYIDGLRSLKSDPELIIFAAIVGIPVRAIGMPFDQVLRMPEMQFTPGLLGQPRASCSGLRSGRLEEAYPPRRFLQVAQGFGEDAVVYSICADDFAPALDTLIDRIATKLSGNCLPRRLKRDADGTVQCDVYELLAPGETKCSTERGHVGKPVKRATQTQEGIEEARLACKMEQVPVLSQRAGTDPGWFYDDFSDQVRSACPVGEQQRILFTFGDLPEGASATFECLQPITSIDPSATGVGAVNSLCDRTGLNCRARSDADYQLACVNGTCQISCESDPDCPPGWVCDTEQGSGMGDKFCQQPTCPSGEATSTTNSSSTGDQAEAPADAGRASPGQGRRPQR